MLLVDLEIKAAFKIISANVEACQFTAIHVTHSVAINLRAPAGTD